MKATASHMISIAAKQLVCPNWNEGFLYRCMRCLMYKKAIQLITPASESSLI